MSRIPIGYSLAVALLLGVLVAAGPARAAAHTVTFSVPPWPGVTVKTEVVRQIFQALGYRTKVTQTSPTIAIQAVSQGQADVELATWIPSQKSTLDAIMKHGHVVIAGTNLKDAKYDIVVPDYVWKAGVHSIADLHKYPHKFGRKIYGIGAGSDGNLLVKKAIKHNTYDLKGWRVMPSSTAAMLTQVKRAVHAHRWIAFLGWKPHWMNIVYHIKYLRDPKNIWGGKSVVYSIANRHFLKAHPDLARFLKQFVITSKTQSEWIYRFSFKKVDKAVVAKHWIMQHPRKVKAWLAGVKALDGKPASQAVEQAFHS